LIAFIWACVEERNKEDCVAKTDDNLAVDASVPLGK